VPSGGYGSPSTDYRVPSASGGKTEWNALRLKAVPARDLHPVFWNVRMHY